MTLRLAAPPGGGRRCGRDGRARLRAAQLRAPRRDRKGEGARQRGRRLQRPRRHSACVDAAPHRLLGLSQAAGEARRAVPRHYGGGVGCSCFHRLTASPSPTTYTSSTLLRSTRRLSSRSCCRQRRTGRPIPSSLQGTRSTGRHQSSSPRRGKPSFSRLLRPQEVPTVRRRASSTRRESTIRLFKCLKRGWMLCESCLKTGV